MKKILILPLLILGLFFSEAIFAQGTPPQGAPGAGRKMPTGRFYGKILDESGTGVAYASVRLYGMRFDTTTKKMESAMISGQLTQSNGEFSLEDVPLIGKFRLKVEVLGYAALDQEVSFGFEAPASGPGQGAPTGPPQGGWAAMAGGMEKDLGNIRLSVEALNLEEVTIEGQASAVTLALDRKIFKVDQNAVSAGGTGVDALRNVPSLSVDLDGNITLRNAAPQLFIDGRPSTLSLDQIPADAIESVEVITNPSARYDAGGGQGGIVNVVLKKERRLGYNGSVRGGMDTRLGYNAGINLNAREGKINAFVDANVNDRRSYGVGETFRENLFGSPLTNVLQENETNFSGRFLRARAGLDWFVNNRNTLTFEGSYTQGRFTPLSTLDIRTDSLFDGRTAFSEAVRLSESTRMFENIGGSVLFKHLFPKNGHEWTADMNINQVRSMGEGTFSTAYISPAIPETQERQSNEGGTQFLTIQTDYVNPLTDKIKIESGLRAALRSFNSDNANFVYSNQEQEFVRVPNFADQFDYVDAVYAAYFIYNQQFGSWGYQAGLRAESSSYSGNLPASNETFDIAYPISLFPSLFVTKQLNELDQIQLSYSRRINRPSFFQLMPFTDFSDSLNLRRGNATLIPEFTNSVELSYQNILAKGHDFLVSAYYKEANDLITTYQFTEFVPEFGREVVVTSYANANLSYAYGMEFTMRNTIFKIVELTSNVNVYNSRVNATNVEAGLIANQLTWFIKENININLPADFKLQLTGEYQSPAAFSPSSGGGFGWRGVTNTAQGYTRGYWFLDAAIQKSFLDRKANLTVGISDIFASRITGQFAESAFFIQESSNIQNPQLVRVNFSYRFGKQDMSLFKRKNMNFNNQGMDAM